MNNIVSFSGGRTSAYLVHLMEQKRKAGEIDNVHYVFMDTGAEHPKTYEFIQKCVEHFGIDLICLRVLVNPERGIGCTYQEVSLDECKPDLQPWKDIIRKYGTPSINGAFCTSYMKREPFKKYCNEKFGKNNYQTWLGMRIDEPRRLKPADGRRYLAEISPMIKNDILGWWKQQPFDLEASENVGNCVFCLKKNNKVLALAEREEKELAQEWHDMLSADEVFKRTEFTPAGIYRNMQTLPQVVEAFAPFTSEEIAMRRRNQPSPCTESCEVFGCQGDLFDEK